MQRTPGALRSYFPQCDADRDRRLSRSLHPRVFLRLAIDRDDLLARWTRPTRLRKCAQPRLSGGVRNAVHFFAGRPGREPNFRSRLYVGRPSDRLRGAGSLMTITAPPPNPSPPVETTTQAPLGTMVPVASHSLSISPLNRRRWQNFKSNRRG